jgi:hypothetical protein
MLASTVQFSNNDQPPITPSFHSSSLGPATEENHSLRHPTACPTHSPLPSTFHALTSSTRRRRRFADVLASDRASPVRSAP